MAAFRTSDPENPFFMSLREEADPWEVLSVDSEESEDDEDAPASRPYMQTLEPVLRTMSSRDITDSEMERTLKDMRRKLNVWKSENACED